MAEVEQDKVQEQAATYLTEIDPQTERHRAQDNGADTLPHLEHFVRLARRVKRPTLLRSLIENALGSELLPLAALADSATGTLPLPSRNALFAVVASLPGGVQSRLRDAAERILLLGDEYGAQAVKDMLDPGHPMDAAVLAAPTDKLSQALHLFLCQEFPAVEGSEDRRFDHAEARQEMLRESVSRKYSSHYLGPKNVDPKLGTEIEQSLRERLFDLFPDIDQGDMLIEVFHRREGNAAATPVVLYTLKASFNGSHVHYRKVKDGEMIDHDDSAVTSAEFAWQPAKGTLSVFCEDKEVRPELAKVFRDVVLGGNGEIGEMPMREFELTGFSTPAMLDRIRKDRIDGVEDIVIQHIVIAKPRIVQTTVRGRQVSRMVASDTRIRKHRYEDRDIYTIAKQDNKLDDLTEYEILQVKLSIKIGKTSFRRAHRVAVEITAPNGFSDRSKTEKDAELVYAQLERIGCAWQY